MTIRMRKGIIYESREGHQPQLQTQMNFWTTERCKTIDTQRLIKNSLEMSSQALITKSKARRERLMEIVEMIMEELRSRA